MDDFEIIVDDLEYLVGLRDDAASSTGSAHAKLAQINADIDAIAAKNIINYGTCVRSAGLYIVDVGGYSHSDNITVNISGQGIANIAKSMITIEGSAKQMSEYIYFEPYIYSASNSSIVLKVYIDTEESSPERYFVSVRVLEFY